jgi:uncharacterized protein YacL
MKKKFFAMSIVIGLLTGIISGGIVNFLDIDSSISNIVPVFFTIIAISITFALSGKREK